MNAEKLVTYFRVSTQRQGRSGLGLEAQKTAVEFYANRVGAEIAASYTEVESGKRNDREELARAIAHAKRSKATLVVAKLDRLARNVAFTSSLMESGVEFIACDQPHANRLTIHILAAVAEHEADMISQRTKSALAAPKSRGVKLGSAREGHWKGREDKRQAGLAKAQQMAAKARKRMADDAYADIADIADDLKAMRAEGLSFPAIAAKLNEQGHTTRRGKLWNPVQVRNVLQRFEQ
ncbi:MAG: recombinase family protein [Rhodopirellula sp.]|nr:recombinase family protein [Rhodopirellula sp.]